MSGGATKPLLKDEEANKLHRNPTIKPHTRVQTAEPKLDLHRGLEVRQERDD